MAKKLKSINPYSGETIAEYPEMNSGTITKILEQADETYKVIRKSSFEDRSVKMFKVAELLKENVEELAGLMTDEMGKVISESRAEVKKCAWVCEYYAENAEKFLSSRMIETDAKKSYVKYEPIGTILAVMPWNFPFWQVFRFAAPTIMAGNTALLKHASNVQGCAEKIEELFQKAGFEKGVFQNLAISSSKVAEIIENLIVKAVTLTGSEGAGIAVAETAGKQIKKSVLELGGSNAFVVLADCNLGNAIDVALTARLQNGGQSCIAAKRFIIEEPVYNDFMEELRRRVEEYLIGDPKEEDIDIGPLSSVSQAETVEEQVVESKRQGAKIITGGKRDKAFFEPTILTGVKPGMAAFDEEIFGPVFAVSPPVKSPGEALELANNSTFGLGINVFTGSEKNAQLFIENANEGAVFINAMVKSDPRLPFGGVKRSGYGRELSSEGIREFVNVKTVYVA
ncbi:MAG: NAD-dependent succinate-semialdehyde dehydrogenase [Bacteroidota bacterium]